MKSIATKAMVALCVICTGVAAAVETGMQSRPAYPMGGLTGLPLLNDMETRSISAENPTGEKGKGGMAIPNPSEPKPAASARAADDLGQGWKVRPFIRINAGETATLMDVEGPGIIQHIWLVEGLSRAHILRFYWDDEETPSIEVPAPDFFAVGHEIFARVNSLPVIVTPRNALNCYWQMPFRERARITLTNEGDQDVPLVAYQITYALTEVPENAGYFHAQWRRATTETENPYVILDGVQGKGRYVGTFLAWTQMEPGWFGEGEIKFYMDGDEEFPTICGTGTEDYFGGSYGFPEPYTTAYLGTTLETKDSDTPPNYWSLYRWHIEDPIAFHSDLRVTIQALGWYPNQKYKLLSDDIASVAFWYQTEPHAPFPPLPPLAERARVPQSVREGFFEGEMLKVLKASAGNARRQDLGILGTGWSGLAHLWWTGGKLNDTLDLALPVENAGKYALHARFTNAANYAIVQVMLNGQALGDPIDLFHAEPIPGETLEFGTHELEAGEHTLTLKIVGVNENARPGSMVGLDFVELKKTGN